MRISLQLSEEMAPLIVKLITTALSGVPFHAKTDSHKHSHQSSGSKGTSKSTDSSTKSKTTSTKQPGTYECTCVCVFVCVHTCVRAYVCVCVLYMHSCTCSDMLFLL